MARTINMTQFELIGVEFDPYANTLTMRYRTFDDTGQITTFSRLVLRERPDGAAPDAPPSEGEYYLTAQEKGAMTVLRRALKSRAAMIMNDPSLEEPE